VSALEVAALLSAETLGPRTDLQAQVAGAMLDNKGPGDGDLGSRRALPPALDRGVILALPRTDPVAMCSIRHLATVVAPDRARR